MYPNPQDVLPLPPRPDLGNYRKRAKELVKACKAGDASRIRAWAAEWVGDLLALQPASGKGARTDVERSIEQVATFARERLPPAGCVLSQAQFVIARVQGFESWPRLVRHLEGLGAGVSAVSTFEAAADAIVAGNLPALDELLRWHPDLIRARSDREHRATLLHYVSANGVENYRQRTPASIIDIARRLLDAGAEVDAEADVYGGGATTLGLVVTSAHPRLAGVQNDLADLLLDRGARMDSDIVRGCLMNGCPEAAAHLVGRGAPLETLEDAAGVGRLDVAQRYFSGDRGPVSPKEATAALMMASWYDRVEIVAFLLDQGIDAGVRSEVEDEGHTALHIAAYQGHGSLVELLVRRGAPVNVTDRKYGTPPFVWALHAWLVESRTAEPYRTVLRVLADAGAEVKEAWITDQRVRADHELYAALSPRVVG